MSDTNILTGTVKLINDLQTFDSGFQKREFVVTTKETYPQDVKFEVVKAKALTFDEFVKVGDEIEVKFNIRGNEYNGKYYVNLACWSWDLPNGNDAPKVGSKAAAPKPITNDADDSLPF